MGEKDYLKGIREVKDILVRAREEEIAARERLLAISTDAINSYIGRMSACYNTLFKEGTEEGFLEGLEDLLQKWEVPKVPTVKEPQKPARRRSAKSLEDVKYDPKKARYFREKEGLTQAGLAKKLRLPWHTFSEISRFERGKRKLDSSSEGDLSRVYFNWYKKQLLAGQTDFNYNPQRAKQIREKAGLSLEGLARELRLPKSAATNINRYERGIYKPSTSRGRLGKKYVSWVKEHDY